MIAITGGNGHLGRATALELLKRIDPDQLIVSVREPEKATELAEKGVSVRHGDFNDLSSLVRAFQGAETVLIISSDAPNEVRTRQHRTAVDAARQAGARHIVYTSILDPNPASPFTFAAIHADTEQYIIDSGLTYTFFRNGWYLETLPLLVGNPAENKAIYFPAGQGRLVFAGRDDIAEALAIVLTTAGHHNQAYDINSGESHSFSDIAVLVSQQLGEPITYVDIPAASLEEGLQKAGLPEFVIAAMVGMSEALKQHRLEKASDTLATLLGRPPKGVAQYLSELMGASQVQA